MLLVLHDIDSNLNLGYDQFALTSMLQKHLHGTEVLWTTLLRQPPGATVAWITFWRQPSRSSMDDLFAPDA